MSQLYFQPPQPSPQRNIELSKLLSWILRHGANEEKLPIDANGYIDIDVILKTHRFVAKKFSLNEIKNVVANDRKQRFALDTLPNGKMRIKANQGHSMANVQMTMTKIDDARKVPIAVHGTYYRFWEKIKAEGLKRMTRNHIHLTENEVFSGDTSGFRSSSEILIYVDVSKAVSDGVVFYRSANNVILTEGLDGVLPSKYFARVVDRVTKKRLL
ncbi:putative tRNA 2'-phosphotransferase [Bradysia coprophila]|uniref:putative tRNA 2'-phosphotransferase n=1 Tax=Bradysia coprophila TaxID=38358 RepID=UPI00187D87A4|nr:putative tRNA 2'-phosphotransferase [Bradysia coprophila]